MKILCHVSGGYDSVAAAIKLLEEGNDVTGLFFNIKQPYFKEEERAVKYFKRFAAEKYKNWNGVYTLALPLELHHDGGGVPSEYIPVRNFVFAAQSANVALAHGFDAVAVGSKTTYIRPDDPYSFRDCSVEFYDKINDIVNYCSEEGHIVKFIMPLVTAKIETGVEHPDIKHYKALTKGQVVKIILDSGLDISELWTCYRPGVKACGECYHCVEAKKAFDEIGESHDGIFQK